MTKIPRITLYTGTGCVYCQQARDFFKSRKIAYRELDIEHSERARKQLQRLGARGVPVIAVGDQHLLGFQRAPLVELLREAGFRL